LKASWKLNQFSGCNYLSVISRLGQLLN